MAKTLSEFRKNIKTVIIDIINNNSKMIEPITIKV